MTKPNYEAFVREVYEYWPEVGTLDGGDLQELGEKHGILVEESRTEPCGENCNCTEYFSLYEMKYGFSCYRLAPSTGDGNE